jgi:citrate lyase beta subunit
MLNESVLAELNERLAPVDAALRRNFPGEPFSRRQPVHTVYVPADRYEAGLPAAYAQMALAAVYAHGPLPFADTISERVIAKLKAEPIEDLRIDFEDGYGIRPDDEEDAAAESAASIVRAGSGVPFIGLRCKSLEAPTRRRAVRTLDLFLSTMGPPPSGFVITLPKVSAVEQVEAMVVLCVRLEHAHGLAAGSLRFEVQVETPPAVIGADGAVTVARMVHAAAGRCVGLHYGTYDYSAAIGIAAQYQSMEHPAADFAKAVMQVAAAGTGVRLSDGSTNVVPVGSTEDVRAAWELHARLVRRSLERGFYQGWDLHPAQLPTRFGATYAFFRGGAATVVSRLRHYLGRAGAADDPQRKRILDEPATARALARFLLRGLNCGALDPSEIAFDRSTLESL